MTNLHQITAANRASWNSIHPARPGQPAAFFADGGSALSPEEVAAAGDVTGRRVLQLACSCGDTALSWAALGASVTGIDISEVAIDLARTKSADAGIPVDFRCADMFDLPADLRDLDLIYLSRHVRRLGPLSHPPPRHLSHPRQPECFTWNHAAYHQVGLSTYRCCFAGAEIPLTERF
ncbi:class I SAM-dependent methyltransferase [Kribbella sp. NPDC020789]